MCSRSHRVVTDLSRRAPRDEQAHGHDGPYAFETYDCLVASRRWRLFAASLFAFAACMLGVAACWFAFAAHWRSGAATPPATPMVPKLASDARAVKQRVTIG